MGRKSLKSQRKDQILDALERCIVEYGLERVTLQKIADQAGVSRSILHHYIGNRADILRALGERIEKTYIKKFLARLSKSSELTLADDMIDFLFEESFDYPYDDETVIRAMIEASARDAELRKQLLEMFQTYEEILSNALAEAYPWASKQTCRSISHAILCTSHGNYSLTWLGFDRDLYPHMRSIVKSLLVHLEEGQSML